MGQHAMSWRRRLALSLASALSFFLGIAASYTALAYNFRWPFAPGLLTFVVSLTLLRGLARRLTPDRAGGGHPADDHAPTAPGGFDGQGESQSRSHPLAG